MNGSGSVLTEKGELTMPDREKVIKEAEEALEFLAPDDKHRLHIGIMMKLGWIYDVIALLKEQQETIERQRLIILEQKR